MKVSKFMSKDSTHDTNSLLIQSASTITEVIVSGAPRVGVYGAWRPRRTRIASCSPQGQPRRFLHPLPIPWEDKKRGVESSSYHLEETPRGGWRPCDRSKKSITVLSRNLFAVARALDKRIPLVGRCHLCPKWWFLFCCPQTA